MKKLVLVLLLLGGFTFGTAQSAKQLLSEVSTKVRSYNNMKVDFKYNLNNAKENVNQDTRGDVTLQGEKYVLNMLGTTMMFDGKNTYTIVPEDEEVTISAYDPNDDKVITPSTMLTFYEKGFTYKMDIEQNVKEEDPVCSAYPYRFQGRDQGYIARDRCADQTYLQIDSDRCKRYQVYHHC